MIPTKMVRCKWCAMMFQQRHYKNHYGSPCTYCGGLQEKSYSTERTDAMLDNHYTQNQKLINQNFQQGNIQVVEECWEVEVDTVKACSKAPEDLTIWVELLAKVKIDALMEKYPNIEWLAYLIGDPENDPYTVTDIFIPKQVVTGTSVTDVICPEFNNLSTIGVIHSHHGMGNGFSGTDHAFVNQNHNISLVIAKDGIAGQARWTTPCGALKIITVAVKPKIEIDFDKEGFLKETENIDEKKYEWKGGQTEAQKKYVNGKSIKEIRKEAKKKRESIENAGEGQTSEANTKGGSDTASNDQSAAINASLDLPARDGKGRFIGKTETNSDDSPVYDEEQSLAEALDEAFTE